MHLGALRPQKRSGARVGAQNPPSPRRRDAAFSVRLVVLIRELREREVDIVAARPPVE
jgi:hypothetical protein